VNLNTIIACTSGDYLEDLVEIALLPDGKILLYNWAAAEGTRGEVMDGGWTRYHNFVLAAW
jgi:hypothetical protein